MSVTKAVIGKQSTRGHQLVWGGGKLGSPQASALAKELDKGFAVRVRIVSTPDVGLGRDLDSLGDARTLASTLGKTLIATISNGFTGSFQWYRDGTVIPGATNIQSGGTVSAYTLTALDIVPGTEITLRPGPITQVLSAGIAPPVAPTVAPPNILAAPIAGSVLTYSAGAVTGLPAPVVTFSLTVGGVAKVLPYTPVAGDAGETLTLTQTAVNAGGVSSSSVSYTVAALIVAPVNTILPVITGSAVVGSTVTFLAGTYSGSAGSVTVQWTLDGVAIPGATSSSYTLVATGVLRVQETKTNLSGSAMAQSSPVTVVAASVAPANLVAPVVSGITAENQVLSVGGDTWANSPLSFAIQWYRGVTLISGATSATYTLVSADVGSQMSARVSATNAAGTSIAISALTAVVTAIPVTDTRPRSGIGSANAWSATPAALLASMVVIPGSSNGGITGGPFSVNPVFPDYGWVAVLASASIAGVTFDDGIGLGGWQGAGQPSNWAGVSPNTSTSTVLYTDLNGTQWRFFRQDYAGSPYPGSISP